MFWGLIMEPNKRYSQLVERSFHLSMASLDVTGANDQPIQVMLCYEDRNYLLCTLKKGSIFQVPLDLNFQEGTKIAFTCNGFGHVHLTGYLTLDEDLDFGDLEEEEEEDEEEEEEEEEEEKVSQLAKPAVKPKRKAVESPKKVSKRAKKEEEVNEDDDSSDDDDLDGDFESDSESEEIKMKGDDEDESDDDSDDDDSNDEPEPEVEKPKQKQKQNQQAQNQLSKKEKQKMVNGSETKQDTGKQKKNKSEQQNSQQQSKRRSIEGGIQVEDLKIGNGTVAKSGKNITVYYIGRLKNGKKFDETRQGEGFKFQLGKGNVIKGWDLGISGMKVGGKRRLTIPPAMGYGHKGSPPVIPGNSTLIFEVELKNVQ